TAPDLSSLVIKLKRARPDVIFHTGYNPDITLFLRQAREQGLRVSALVGHGAGYGVYDRLKESVGKDASHIFNVDPISIWLAGQNDRAFPVIVQYIDDKAHVVWPKSLQHHEPVLPLPSSSPYAAN